ncbi:transcriptional regulator [Shouchella clausii]|uniref:helix-turn-helix domain-containing protein n=1 Tax=Shouchella clausii TaxID=79880 RepID=UPI0015C7DEF0|nr:helix-turn-helix transcriptional regulator [Shouchella clausii]GIN13161.1 transcriptional regulator [Shouchella clausii]
MTGQKKVEVKLLELMAKNNIRKVNELAKKADVSSAHLYKLINGQKHGLRFDTIYKLCVALNCEVGDLIVAHPPDRMTS